MKSRLDARADNEAGGASDANRETADEASAESWSDQELLQRMRHDEALAIREFYRRFAPVLWKLARQAHVQPALRDDVVTDCLSDAAIHLMQPTVAIPANLTGYLVATFRHRLANDRRATKRRTATGTAATWPGDGERVVREVVSEASTPRERRAGRGSAAAVAGARATVARHRRRHHRRGTPDPSLGQRRDPAATHRRVVGHHA